MFPACRTFALCLLPLAAATAPLRAQSANPFAGWFDGWYAGAGMSYVNLEIPGRDVEISGIQFTDVNARTDGAGFKIFLGYWIDPHLAIELAGADLGHADATFAYHVAPAESGTGSTTVDVSTTSLSLLLAQPIGRWNLFLRGGVQAWTLSYKTQFRLAAGGSQYRELDQKGNGALWGAGVEWTLRKTWRLRLEGEAMKMDITDAKVMSLGVVYRF